VTVGEARKRWTRMNGPGLGGGRGRINPMTSSVSSYVKNSLALSDLGHRWKIGSAILRIREERCRELECATQDGDREQRTCQPRSCLSTCSSL
jgi:hypothetical protein